MNRKTITAAGLALALNVVSCDPPKGAVKQDVVGPNDTPITVADGSVHTRRPGGFHVLSTKHVQMQMDLGKSYQMVVKKCMNGSCANYMGPVDLPAKWTLTLSGLLNVAGNPVVVDVLTLDKTSGSDIVDVTIPDALASTYILEDSDADGDGVGLCQDSHTLVSAVLNTGAGDVQYPCPAHAAGVRCKIKIEHK